MTWEELIKDLSSTSPDLSDHYLFWGEQNYFVNKALTRLLYLWSPEGKNDLNFQEIQGPNVLSPEAFREFLESLFIFPFMSEKRLLILEEVQSFTDEQWKELFSTLEKPGLPTRVLINAASADATFGDKKKKFFQKWSEKLTRFCCVEFKKIADYKIMGWIPWVADSLGLKLGPQVSERLYQKLGADLQGIELALIKIKSGFCPIAQAGENPSSGLLTAGEIVAKSRVAESSGPKPSAAQFPAAEFFVTVEQVEALIPRSRDENIFEWIDRWILVANQDPLLNPDSTLDLLVRLKDLKRQGNGPFVILSLLARQVRLLLKVKQSLLKNKIGDNQRSDAEWAQILGVPPFVVKKVFKQAQAWDESQLRKVLIKIAQLDRTFKNSSAPETLIMEELVLRAV
jgi:DNA polymerase III delta subunit